MWFLFPIDDLPSHRVKEPNSKFRRDLEQDLSIENGLSLSMIPEKEAWEEAATAESYQEALRRVRLAEKTGAVHLDLRGLNDDGRHTGLYFLDRLPPELAGLGSLQSLDLSNCDQLTDLSALASLASLHSLDLIGCTQLSDISPLAGLTNLLNLSFFCCEQLSDLSPLAGLTSLQSLNLYSCPKLRDLSPLAGLTSLEVLDVSRLQITRFGPLESLLPTLKELRLYGNNLEDLPIDVFANFKENVIDRVRAYFGQSK
jgi:Leucine Rich Repeat (LRR) protein